MVTALGGAFRFVFERLATLVCLRSVSITHGVIAQGCTARMIEQVGPCDCLFIDHSHRIERLWPWQGNAAFDANPALDAVIDKQQHAAVDAFAIEGH